MNKREVLEIKKQFSPANCAITRICGCYVDHEKEKRMELKQAFLSLPEEEAFKYFEIFKKTLSGNIGKHLLNMEFPLEQEEVGGRQDLLLELRNSKLENDELLEEFYDAVVENYEYVGNYYIVLIHSVYDVPGKATDETVMFDSSDYVYDHILCCICPVNLTEAGLSYVPEENLVTGRIRDWVVGKPMNGFLFPAFHDRGCDIHNVLYYSQKPEKVNEFFIEGVLGCEPPKTAENQKESFQTLLMGALGEILDFNIAQSIHDELMEVAEEHREDAEPFTVTKADMKAIMGNAGVLNHLVDRVCDEYDELFEPNENLLLNNIADTKIFCVKTPSAEVKVRADMADLVNIRKIDGVNYITIMADEYLEVNGVVTASEGRQNEKEEV